jgi:hypothetical protein
MVIEKTIDNSGDGFSPYGAFDGVRKSFPRDGRFFRDPRVVVRLLRIPTAGIQAGISAK